MLFILSHSIGLTSVSTANTLEINDRNTYAVEVRYCFQEDTNDIEYKDISGQTHSLFPEKEKKKKHFQLEVSPTDTDTSKVFLS